MAVLSIAQFDTDTLFHAPSPHPHLVPTEDPAREDLRRSQAVGLAARQGPVVDAGDPMTDVAARALCQRYETGWSEFDNGLGAGRHLAAVSCDRPCRTTVRSSPGCGPPAARPTTCWLLDAHRVLTTDQLARATGTPVRTVRHRLDRRRTAGLVDAVRPGREAGSTPRHWWLRVAGARLVAARLATARSGWTPRDQEDGVDEARTTVAATSHGPGPVPCPSCWRPAAGISRHGTVPGLPVVIVEVGGGLRPPVKPVRADGLWAAYLQL
ncbi:replication-relaxation family protein [Micromonospora schwarzwaldensis]